MSRDYINFDVSADTHHLKFVNKKCSRIIMAAFYKYICRFENCMKKFNSLFDLIDHIEYSHIIRDPIVLKQQELSQPPAVALSYVNCFFSEHFRKDRQIDDRITAVGLKDFESDKKLYQKNNCLNDSFDSLLDDDTFSDVGSDDSCQSWATNNSSTNVGMSQEHSTHLNHLNNTSNIPTTITTESLQGKFTCLEDSEGKKRFLCTVPGCTKKYKNINGIKYHVKNGHNKKENFNGEIKKNYLCHCGKAYKSQSGLRHHQNTQHNMSLNQPKPYTPVQYDVRMGNNFKQPRAKQPHPKQSLPPVAEMYQPQTPLSTEIVT